MRPGRISGRGHGKPVHQALIMQGGAGESRRKSNQRGQGKAGRICIMRVARRHLAGDMQMMYPLGR